MKTTDFAKSIDNLPKKQRLAILEVIDLKTASDMKEVLHKLDSMNNRITTLYWLIGALGFVITVLKFINV